MTADDLISEGRRLQRPTIVLTAEPTGECAAFWYGNGRRQRSADGHHCWLSVDARLIPSHALTGWLSVFTDDRGCEGGRVEVTPSAPDRSGLPLFAHKAAILPPIEAVFARGGPAVGQWLGNHGWERRWGYNDNFPDRGLTEPYQSAWFRECAIYRKDIYATLGGWHFPWPDGDWEDLIDQTLVLSTFAESEPWVEMWQEPAGLFKVVQRIT
jgi:hypothetical protein